MVQAADAVTISVPRNLLAQISQLSSGLTEKMHELLERNTNGQLTPSEKSELETLVRLAEFGQIVSMAARLQPQNNP
jgi:DNA-binding protein H-NS